MSLTFLDYAAISLYFFVVAILAVYASRKNRTQENSEDYFLAGRNSGWFIIGASLFASNIGSEHLVGLAGSGASGGVPVAQFEILASFILIFLGWFFAPYYLRSGITTMPQFLLKRYGKSAQNYLSFISVLSYVITKISVTIYAGGVVFSALGVDFWVGAVIIVIVTGLYTVMGGLKAVLYTDAMQTFLIIGGSLLVLFLSLKELGGVGELAQYVPHDYFSLWRAADHPDFPWTGILFGAPILGTWYWCTDQFIVQRVLSAKNLTEARRGAIFAGYLKVLPLFIFVIPGILAYALAQKGVLEMASTDQALPLLITTILPQGIKGLVLASLLAALMSSLSSVFNSCSTLITYDLYKTWFPIASEKKLVVIGRISTVGLVVAGLLWIPLMGNISSNLFQYIQSVQAYISPPIAAVFLLGILMPQLNHKGAMAALWTGFILGIGRLTLETTKSLQAPSLEFFYGMNFLHFAIFLFGICSLVLVAVSAIFKGSQLTLELKEIPIDTKGKKLDFWLSVALVLIVLAIWLWFS